MFRGTADGYVRPRRRMVERIAAQGVRDLRVRDALASVERHRLIPEALRGQAYRDAALPIDAGQTISAPGIVARMTQALALTLGRPGDAPFDAILVTARAPRVPEPLIEQLAPGGRLVGPFGRRGAQSLLRLVHRSDGRLGRETRAPCRFVDLIGAEAFAA